MLRRLAAFLIASQGVDALLRLLAFFLVTQGALLLFLGRCMHCIQGLAPWERTPKGPGADLLDPRSRA